MGPIPQRSDPRHPHPLDVVIRQPPGHSHRLTVAKTEAHVLLALADTQLELLLYTTVVPGTFPNFNSQKCPGRTWASSFGDQNSRVCIYPHWSGLVFCSSLVTILTTFVSRSRIPADAVRTNWSCVQNMTTIGWSVRSAYNLVQRRVNGGECMCEALLQ